MYLKGNKGRLCLRRKLYPACITYPQNFLDINPPFRFIPRKCSVLLLLVRGPAHHRAAFKLMTITHDAQEKAFENGKLAQQMQDFADNGTTGIRWYQDQPNHNPPLSFHEIHFHLKYIQEQLFLARKQGEYHLAQKHFQEVESKLQELIERVK